MTIFVEALLSPLSRRIVESGSFCRVDRDKFLLRSLFDIFHACFRATRALELEKLRDLMLDKLLSSLKFSDTLVLAECRVSAQFLS